MYIAIDMTTLNILCKHPNFMRCWDYSIISVGDNFQVFPVEDRRCWASLTDVEIQMLYMHMTGSSAGIILSDEKIFNVLIQYIMEAEETKIFECVHKQAEWCVKNEKTGYKYVIKADVPAKADVIWPTFGLNKELESSAVINKDVWKEAVGAEWQPARGTADIGSGGKTPQRATQPREKAPGNAGVQGSERPARNGACARIWEVADNEAAKDEYSAILESKDFKKHVRELLVAEGINPSTISVQLSKWQKEKGLI